MLRQEQTGDILAFGGVSRDTEANQESYWKGRIHEAVRRRIGWLLLLFLAGTLTSSVSHFFKGVQLALPDLINFVPLLIGTGGNAGSQTVGTIIRALALGEIQRNLGFRVLYREWLSGLLMGILLERTT
jgi:magnesium transporter